jgi:DNA-binding XRE family transcriptional regulator/quercetin dioxygenase-like cupin family protein
MPDYPQASPLDLGAFNVGALLKKVREQNGLSQRELAKRSGVTHSSISMIEQGQNSPSINSLEKILNAIPMTLAQFFMCDLNYAGHIVHRACELTSQPQHFGIMVQPIPHQNAARFQKMILAIAADTGAAPLTANQALSGVVIAGQLELTANMNVATLHTGDAFTLAAKQAYRLRNLSATEECVLWVCEA